jgi:hypothetical protein
LGVDLATGSGFEELERHIESCPACQSILEKLAHQESFAEEPLVSLAADRKDLPEINGFVIRRGARPRQHGRGLPSLAASVGAPPGDQGHIG